ncbi:MAG: pyridoxamine 5'-phosphate oxidase [Gluconacetobacter diazotrophicus]|nr:pyridoxamine 5'-phosphate oxidase [Gluconacetobacter diazotrophicus]
MPDEVRAGAQAGALEVVADPIALFRRWLDEAGRSEPEDANAMALATCARGGIPSVRMVLLKDVDERGFVFYTNKQSRKGEQLAGGAGAGLLFHWKSLRRQVRVEGPVEDVSPEEADAYFSSRARVSRLGALASEQSRPLPSRDELERRVAVLDREHPGDAVPRPPHWSGYRVLPDLIEFWQDMPFRLHDRIAYRRRSEDDWQATRLYP